jgi:hypothetical protein
MLQAKWMDVILNVEKNINTLEEDYRQVVPAGVDMVKNTVHNIFTATKTAHIDITTRLLLEGYEIALQTKQYIINPTYQQKIYENSTKTEVYGYYNKELCAILEGWEETRTKYFSQKYRQFFFLLICQVCE